MFTLASCKSTIHNSISKVFGFLVTGMQLCVNRGSRQRICGYGRIGSRKSHQRGYVYCEKTAYLFIRHTFSETIKNCSPQQYVYSGLGETR
jgi:hypothetical protein